MHQSFATTSPRGPGNSGDIDFSICNAQIKSLHCRDFVLVKSLLKVPAPGELLPDSWTFIMNPCNIKPTKRSIDKIKKKVAESGDILLFTSKFSIRSVATDKLNKTAIFYKWTFILLNRNQLFVILNQVNSQNKTLLQLTLDLLSFLHIEISHLAILQIPVNILSKHCTISW